MTEGCAPHRGYRYTDYTMWPGWHGRRTSDRTVACQM